MANVSISPLADLDLFEIGLHVAQNNPAAAERLIDDITAKFHVLANNPRVGVARDWLRPGLRMFPTRGHLIFHVPTHDGIEVARVLHGSRDVDTLF